MSPRRQTSGPGRLAFPRENEIPPSTARRPARGPRAVAVAVALAAVLPSALLVSGRAAAGPAARSAGPALTITSLSPKYAGPTDKITVTGTLTNDTPAPISGITIVLESSPAWLSSRAQLRRYAAGANWVLSPLSSATWSRTKPLAPSATTWWTIRVRASVIGMTRFGVYPLAAAAFTTAGLPLGFSRTFLPYWPGKAFRHPARQRISWIWPLIDQPQLGPCGELSSNELASSVADGRLARLLAIGGRYGGPAKITWAIDPALLSDVHAMAARYTVGGGPDCHGGTSMPGSTAARHWLSSVSAVGRTEPTFLTPYGDADINGLIQGNLASSLAASYQLGTTVAGQMLGWRNGNPPASVLTGVAWPASGSADLSVVETLAAVDGVKTLLLDSTAISAPAGSASTGVASTLNGEGGHMRVLLADHTLTDLLNSASSANSAGSRFAVRQRFLAETAMIAAEDPAQARAIVVAPPRRWDPPPGLAAGLLRATTSVPWLRPVTASTLLSGTLPRRSAPARSRPSQTTAEFTRRLTVLDRDARLLGSVRVGPDDHLAEAMAGVGSSAWISTAAGRRHAQARIALIERYIRAQLTGVTASGPGRAITLGGLSGTVLVSISNQLSYPVRVRILLRFPADSSLRITGPTGPVEVAAQTVQTVKLKATAARTGTTVVRLGLAAASGQPLPTGTVSVTIQATHFGTLALIVLAIALSIFVLTSATRAMRRGRGSRPVPADQGADAQPGTRRQEQSAAPGSDRTASRETR